MDENFESTGQVKIKIPKGHKLLEQDNEPQSDQESGTPSDSPPESVLKAKSINLQEYLDQSLADLKLQLNYYQNVCSQISAGDWRATDVVDYLFVLVKSLNFDAVSLLMVDPDNFGQFMPMVSRGYHHPPEIEMEEFWRPCIKNNGEEVNWDALLALAQRSSSPFSSWVDKEKIFRIGYSPVQDGERITGFMIISSYMEKHLSPLASVLLELCGGHIGLALAARRARGKAGGGEGDLGNAKSALLKIKGMLSELHLDSGDFSVEQVNSTIEQSRKLIDQVLGQETR